MTETKSEALAVPVAASRSETLELIGDMEEMAASIRSDVARVTGSKLALHLETFDGIAKMLEDAAAALRSDRGGVPLSKDVDALLNLAYALREEYDVGDSEFGPPPNDAPDSLMDIIVRLEARAEALRGGVDVERAQAVREVARQICGMAAVQPLEIADVERRIGKLIDPAALRTPTDSKAVAGAAWRPIETAPKDGTDILTWDDCGAIRIGWFYDVRNAWFYIGQEGRDFNPTHWMPLPSAPVESQPVSTPDDVEVGS